ncbi:MAG: LapA family protein [Cardiobacteriaceae bacterium]|nr:LapA family protein [Cardiobacteriaceae bacterium]
MKTALFYLAVLVLCALFFVLGLLNRETVEFDFVLGKETLPLIFVMLISFIFGAFLTLFVFGIKVWYWKGRAQSLEKEIANDRRNRENAAARRDFEQDKKA